MPPTENDYQNALTIALNFFLAERDNTSETLLEEILDNVLLFPKFKSLDRDRLRTMLEQKVSIIIAAPQVLDSKAGHIAWLPDKRAEIDWDFWHRYRRFLVERKAWAPATIQSIDDATDQILERLEDPTDVARAWDRRGMVVGHVQSGKTANFTGLICKAVDAGYKLIIVLAGQHNNLRAQTQMRLDEEFLGVDTAEVTRADNPTGQIGVRQLPGVEHPPVISLTTRTEDGDFKANRTGTNLPLGELPVILVVKKRANILQNVYRWLAHGQSARLDATVEQMDPTCGHRGRHVIDDVPVLLIDDEADHSSVNTSELPLDDDGRPVDDYNPTRINALIRQILTLFPQKAYVGYTATPFANIFIHDEAPHRIYGPDLFPESFIISLPTPSNYHGPVQVFGLADNRRRGQPIVRRVDDYQLTQTPDGQPATPFVPDRHNSSLIPGPLPPSLKEALRAFVLTCTLRRVRGQTAEHNSMLIHVTRFKDVQARVHDLVKREFDDIRNQIRYGSGARGPDIRTQLRELWERDFEPTSAEMGVQYPGVTWTDIDAGLLAAVEKITIKTINGTSGDILDYRENASTGISVIAIGGDKLSRGLTLEGLSISYYLRASRMYDTLMQMGRWFGYRPGYEDLCRIYTTETLARWYQQIAEANEELRQDFEFMVMRGETPKTYGLRVRSHPGLMVTSSVKMRTGETLELSYDGRIPEMTVYEPQAPRLDHNFNITETFLRQLAQPDRIGNHYVWRDVSAEDVVDYLRRFATHPSAPHVNGGRIAEYIAAQVEREELTSWTIALINRNSGQGSEDDDGEETAGPSESITIAGLRVEATQRKPSSYKRGNTLSIKRLLSPGHETLDLSADELEQAMALTKAVPRKDADSTPKRPAGRAVRAVRPVERGLLMIVPLDRKYIVEGIRTPEPDKKFITADPDFELKQTPIGFAISFPTSENAHRVRYEVNNVWQREEEEDLL